MNENIVIVQGSDREFNVRLIDADTKEPIDLSTVTEADIQADFVQADGGCLSLTGAGPITIVSALGGKIKITMSQANTTALKPGLAQNFEVEWTKAGKKSIVQFMRVLDVLKQVC